MKTMCEYERDLRSNELLFITAQVAFIVNIWFSYIY